MIMVSKKTYILLIFVFILLLGFAVNKFVLKTPAPSVDKSQQPSVLEEYAAVKEERCATLVNSGSTTSKINIYFYEDGFNSKQEIYDTYVSEIMAVTFGGSFNGRNHSGIEPFKSLKQEFNVFSYKDVTNINDGSCWPPASVCGTSKIRSDLQNYCAGFMPATDALVGDGNYNIIVIPFDEEGWGSGTGAIKRLSSTTVRIGANDTIYHNINLSGSASLVHEFGHSLGFFDEEYSYYDLYLGAKTIYPNIDSASCNKWCRGVDRQSACYTRYLGLVNCFKEGFVNNNSEIKSILQENNLDYVSNGDFDWWGECFNVAHINSCGNRIAYIVDSKVRPSVYDLNQSPDSEWLSSWDYCKNQFSDVWGNNACNLGFMCGSGNGCYAGESLSRFLPSPENSHFMGVDYVPQAAFNQHDEDILRHNILNKVRYIDIENPEKSSQNSITPL